MREVKRLSNHLRFNQSMNCFRLDRSPNELRDVVRVATVPDSMLSFRNLRVLKPPDRLLAVWEGLYRGKFVTSTTLR